jgi:hypothetical protein
MKIKLKNFLVALVVLGLTVSSCKKSDEEEEDEPSTTREASFKVGSTAFTVTKPTLSIFNDNGVIKNTMKLVPADGSKVEFYYVGSAPATYPLMSFSNGYYKNASGKQYNSISGSLVVSDYKIDGAIYKASGTFSFKAVAIAAPFDTLDINTGVFTNASNEL